MLAQELRPQRLPEEARSLFNYGAPAVRADEILTTFPAGTRDHKLLIVFWSAREVAIGARIVVIAVHGLDAEDIVVAAERRVRSGGPTPANVNVGDVAGECSANCYRLYVGGKPSSGDEPRHASKEAIVVEIPGNRCRPQITDGVKRCRSGGSARVNCNVRIRHGLIHRHEIPARIFVLKLHCGPKEGNVYQLLADVAHFENAVEPNRGISAGHGNVAEIRRNANLLAQKRGGDDQIGSSAADREICAPGEVCVQGSPVGFYGR